MFKVIQRGEGISHVQGDGVRGVSHFRGDWRGASNGQGDMKE